ncbi:FprA family A-type flavoprotein [Methanococcus voltae]|uniref:Beta-lactamase domain protein n=1 Tax=Methanococcus voltae (strain ATCC BAA-1334 / A3) TaxID=456320 RepID=D7DTI2_METV3|nr:FprA family A-type flavoprotein [Methanococcus voltae]MCS3901294.1 flavorubredoxin [Methanococcus voltae]
MKITDRVYQVGVVDWKASHFHGFDIHGTSYNSYLILDDKKVIIDAVKKEYYDAFIENIAKVINPQKIDYIVINHSEMDHSSSLEYLVRDTGAKVIANKVTKEYLERMYDTREWHFVVVDTNETLEIGERTLKFIRTPMLHWTDNMVTYSSDGVLYSNDAFGQHLASSERFADQIDGGSRSFYEAKDYFASIILPYRMFVGSVLEELSQYEINYICPAHGTVWRGDLVDDIIYKYAVWSSDVPENKAVILYGTMYGATEKIAYALADGLINSGVKVRILNTESSINTIMNEIMNARYVLVGSPTMNANIYPPVRNILSWLEDLKPVDKVGVAFGSYGWVECATEHIEETFKKLNYKVIDDDCLKIRFTPQLEELRACREFGRKLGSSNHSNE